MWRKAWGALSGTVEQPDGALRGDDWQSQFQDVKGALEKAFHLPKSGRFPWVLAVDNVDCMHQHGDALPPGVTAGDIGALRKHLADGYVSVFSSQESCQLAMGRLVEEIMAEIERSASGSPEAIRLALYSGHDATLMPLAATLGRPCDTWPPYSSFICIELWGSHDNRAHFVRVLYNGEEVALPPAPPPAGGSWPTGGDRPGAGATGVTLLPLAEFAALAGWSRISEDAYQRGCAGQAAL